MAIRLNGQSIVVDPSSIIAEMNLNESIDTSILQQCNSLRRRNINGYGKGYFLLIDKSISFSGDRLTFVSKDNHEVTIEFSSFDSSGSAYATSFQGNRVLNQFRLGLNKKSIFQTANNTPASGNLVGQFGNSNFSNSIDYITINSIDATDYNIKIIATGHGLVSGEFIIMDNGDIFRVAVESADQFFLEGINGKDWTDPGYSEFYKLPAIETFFQDEPNDFLVLEVAEPKYELHEFVVERSYNVLDREQTTVDGTVTKAYFPPDDQSQFTMAQVISDFLTPTGHTLLAAPDILDDVYDDILIEGLTVLEAIDYICQAFGLLWTVDDNGVIISEVPNINTVKREAEVNHSVIHAFSATVKEVNVAFLRYYKDGQTGRKEGKAYHEENKTHNDQPNAAGVKTVRSFFPFRQAFYENPDDDAPINAGELTQLFDDLAPLLTKAGEFEGIQIEKHQFRLDTVQPAEPNSFETIWCDTNFQVWMERSEVYPFLEVPLPRTPVPPPMGMGSKIGYTVQSVTTAGTSSPYNGLKVAQVTVSEPGCGLEDLTGTTVEVVDHSGCIFNEDNAALVGRYGWAYWGNSLDLSIGAGENDFAGCHWCADGLCCPPE